MGCATQNILAAGVDGVVEIESQWTSRKREALGIAPTVRLAHPVANNATRACQAFAEAPSKVEGD